jgi:hypothetical protein
MGGEERGRLDPSEESSKHLAPASIAIVITGGKLLAIGLPAKAAEASQYRAGSYAILRRKMARAVLHCLYSRCSHCYHLFTRERLRRRDDVIWSRVGDGVGKLARMNDERDRHSARPPTTNTWDVSGRRLSQ